MSKFEEVNNNKKHAKKFFKNIPTPVTVQELVSQLESK
jgi:hypothetical protein